jgi:hypothetical protein
LLHAAGRGGAAAARVGNTAGNGGAQEDQGASEAGCDWVRRMIGELEGVGLAGAG